MHGYVAAGDPFYGEFCAEFSFKNLRICSSFLFDHVSVPRDSCLLRRYHLLKNVKIEDHTQGYKYRNKSSFAAILLFHRRFKKQSVNKNTKVRPLAVLQQEHNNDAIASDLADRENVVQFRKLIRIPDATTVENARQHPSPIAP